MKRSARCATLVLAILAHARFALPAAAAHYFVSTNGTDYTNDGLSSTSSWRTIAYAIQCVSSGDVINIGTGEFTEPVLALTNSITLSGTNVYIPTNQPLNRHLSRTVIKPIYTNNPAYPVLIHVKTNGISIRNLTINGDVDTNGIPDLNYAIYSTNRPLCVSNCIICNIQTYAVTCYGLSPPISPDDNNSMRSYFGYNLISNIVATNPGTATALMLNKAPSTCEFNEFAHIKGSNSFAGIYMTDCKYTANMSAGIIIRSNYFSDCTTAVWANQFGDCGEKITIASNIITNGLIGIRITSALGQAIVSGNSVSVSGLSDSAYATPARGIWLQADRDPWGTSNTLMQTDHLITGNQIYGASTQSDGTVGLLLAYNSSITPHDNNGVRATLTSNSISQFDFGSFIESGTNGMSNPHSPLVRATFHSNDFSGHISYALLATGTTEMIDASNNWWGSYFGPTGTAGSAVSTNILFSWHQGAYLKDSNANGTNDWLDTDDDGDGLNDTNEMALGSAPDKADTDSDGMNDRYEYIAGTDMTNSLSLFTILTATFTPTGNLPVLSWLGATGRHYSVYRTTDIKTGTFQKISGSLPAACPAFNIYTDSTATVTSSPVFYRLTVTN